MSILVNNYPIFEDNQVLNSDQLNQLIKYLDQQERLTRSCLIGMGIACGLELEIVQDEGGRPAIIIHEGLGISSEGFLIKLCPESTACVTVQYRDYKLPEGTVYTPFQNDLLEQDVELFELLTDQFVAGDDETIEPLANISLNDKVVLLFLECLDKDLKSCLGKSCDELGRDRIFSLRKLLISKTDLDKVNLRSNGGRQDDLFLDKFKLKDISLPRVFLKEINTAHYLSFAFKYIESINFVYHPLRELLAQSYITYEPILNDEYGGNPFERPVIKNAFEMLDKYLNGELVEPVWLGVQYVYDFFKDLILAYQEFKDCAYDLMIQCCPDMSRFPRHLMLGRTSNVVNEQCEIDKYRHSFTQPSIYNNQKYLLAKTLSLHKRIVLMLEKFSFERLQHTKNEECKLTPSCEKKSLLSSRSIPFYYDSKSKSNFSRLDNLEFEWNYERSYKHCQVQENKSEALNLSYDNNTMADEAISPLTTPLHFDIDRLNFLRIEGFQREQLKDALPKLREVKNEANLDFDVKVTYFGHQLDESQVPDCLFREVQPDYEIWRSKFLYCLVALGKLVDISRFAVSDESKLREEPLDPSTGTGSDLKNDTINNLKAKVNSRNWPMATDEVLHRTASLNMRQWTRGKSKNPNSTRGSGGKEEITDLFIELRECLIKLRQEMPESFQSFKFNEWLEVYKCPLRIAVKALKLVSAQIDVSQITVQINTYFSLFCQLHGLLRNIAIYPYIEIGILKNTLKAKMKDYNRAHQFSNFIEDNPGTVHKAGTEQGQTFVLLYQAEFSEEYLEEVIPAVHEYLQQNEVPEPVIEELHRLETEPGAILGDFNIPHQCCNPCDRIPTRVAQLHPIAAPIIETVPISQFDSNGDGQLDSFSYGFVKEKLLHEVYEVERYNVKLTGDLPKFGTATIEFAQSDWNEDVLVPYLRYKVNVEAIIGLGTDDGYLIDEFPYQIEHALTGELFDASVITILVPNLNTDTQVGKVGVRGRVITRDESGAERPVGGALIQLSVNNDTILEATSVDSGEFTISTIPSILPNGEYSLLTTKLGFPPQTTPVTIKNDVPFVTIELLQFTISIPPVLGDLIITIGEDPTSKKTIEIINDFKETNIENKAKIRMLIKKDGDRQSSLNNVEKTMSLLVNDNTLSAREVSNAFSKNRDALLTEISKAKGEARKVKVEGLSTLTTVFMDRVAIMEPNELSEISKKTLADTGVLFKAKKVNMKTNMNKWTSRKGKVLGTKNANRFKANMKL